jgi:microcystin degradation protein MlrC
MSRPPIRIAVLFFCHETVTFLPNDTTRADFVSAESPASGDALLTWERDGYLGGFVQVAREHDGVSLEGIESPYWPRTGTGSGWITTDAYEHFVGRMIAGLRAQGPFDGVYLALHGAMGVRGIPRPEAELARRVRAAVGPGCRIAGTFDPHGNEDAAFLEQADFAFAVKYFPHYDAYLQGERAARMLIRAIRGDYAPSHAVRKVPILSPTVMQWTGASPWMDLVQRALVWEAREVDVYVNVFFGFPWADVPDAGMTIQVTTNGRPDRAAAIATDLAAAAWRMRQSLVSAARVLRMGEGHRITLHHADGGTESRPEPPFNLQEIKLIGLQIVQTQLSRGSSFIAMLGRDPHPPALGRERDQWSSMFSNCTARAVRSSPSPSSLWRRARLTGHPMIELPHQLLNAIFAAVIIVADVRRSRNWLRGSPDVHERS